MNEDRVVKVTVSMPQHLLEYADRLARERGISRSGVFCQLLAREETEELHALMAEGYREMAEENRRLAEEGFPLTAETMLRNTKWDEGSSDSEG
jgi:metal-responsive CopG/Arc/MetJ family transcriptional regulator